MANITFDHLEGHDAQYAGTDGWTIKRRARVTGVTGTGAEKLYNAVFDTNMPDIGDAHPDIAGTYLRYINPIGIENDEVIVDLEYITLAGTDTEYQIGGSSSQEDSNLDSTGTEVEVEYTYPTDYKEASYQGFTDVQGAVFSKHVPEVTYTITKAESMTQAQVLALAKSYVGKVNQLGWDLDSSAEAGSWLCVGINGRKTTTSDMIVTYTFSWKPSFTRDSVTYPGWYTTVIYTDPNTGKPPEPATWGANTVKVLLPYETADFDNLDLDT